MYLKGLWKTLREYVRRYAVCHRNKHENVATAGTLQPLKPPQGIFSEITMDFIEGLPKSQDKTVIMVVVDRLTKFAHFICLAHPYTTKDVAQIFLDYVY